MRRSILIFLVACLLLHSSVPVLAQEVGSEASPSAAPEISILPPPDTAINLTLSPVSIVLETEPGVPVTNQIKIRNNSTTTEQLELSIGSFIASPTGDQPRLLDPKPDDPSLEWLQIDKDPFTIGPSEWKTISFTFSPPKDAALSYYYSIIVSRPLNDDKKDGQAVIIGSPAILVLTTVKSPLIKRELQVTDFRVSSPFLEYLPQQFFIKVKNTGNVHLAPSGNVFIDGQGKKDLAILLANPTRSMILPGSEREYLVEWSDGFPVYQKEMDGDREVKDSDGESVYTLKLDFSNADKFRFGRFTGHLLFVYDNGERDVPIESNVSFWVIPWKILLVIAVIALLVLGGVFAFLRSLWKLARKKK